MTTIRKSHSTIESLKTFIFEGFDGEECEDLIHAVRLHAREIDKIEDHGYMARWASGCMVGNALRWYVLLPKEIKYDWEELERALLLEYPINNEARSEGRRPRPNDVREGRIKVVSGDPTRDGYLPCGPNPREITVPITSVSEALRVQCSGSGSSRLRLLNQAPISGTQYDFLGVVFGTGKALGQGLAAWACLTPATLSSNGTSLFSQNFPGEKSMEVWRVAQDNSISVHWNINGQSQELVAGISSNRHVYVMCQSDLAAFLREHEHLAPARLFLEPIA